MPKPGELIFPSLFPKVLALVPCERLIIGPVTSAFTMINVYRRFMVPSFPVTIPRMVVYMAVNNGKGSVPLTISVTGSEGGVSQGFVNHFSMDFADPLDEQETGFILPPLELNGPGELRLALSCQGEILMERRLFVQHVPHGNRPA